MPFIGAASSGTSETIAMGISGVGQNNFAAVRQQRQEQAFKSIDQDQNGSASLSELKKAEEQTTARDAKAVPANGQSAADRFSAADSNGDNALSLDEFSTMMARMEVQAGTGSGPTAREGAGTSGSAEETGGRGIGGPPGGSGVGGPPGGASGGESTTRTASSTSSSDSTSSTADPADHNGDGTVTAAEQVAYDVKHPGARTKTDSATGATSLNVVT